MKRISKYKKNIEDDTSKKKNYILITDFSKTNDKYCIDADKKNDKIYRNALSNINEAIRIIESNGLTANLYVPPPPKPTNHEKYLLWKKRSVSKPVILQSYAVLYLQKKGYVLDRDYESYQAIEIANEILLKENGTLFDHIFLDKHKNNFKHLFTKLDKNILRRRSLKKHLEEDVDEFDFTDIPSIPGIPIIDTPPCLRKNRHSVDPPSYSNNYQEQFEPITSQSYPPSSYNSLYPEILPSAPPCNLYTFNNNPKLIESEEVHDVRENFLLDPSVSERKVIFRNNEVKKILEKKQNNQYIDEDL